MKTIVDYPAYTICEAEPNHEFKTGDIFAISFGTWRGSLRFKFYALGCVEDFAKANHQDHYEAIKRASSLGHELYWANLEPTCLTAQPQAKRMHLAVKHNDIIRYKGVSFKIVPAPNDNVRLVPLVQ